MKISPEKIGKQRIGIFETNADLTRADPKVVEDILKFSRWMEGRKVIYLKAYPVTIQGKTYAISSHLKIPCKKQNDVIQFKDIKDKMEFGPDPGSDKLIKDEIDVVVPITNKEKQKQVIDEWLKYHSYALNAEKDYSIKQIFTKKGRKTAIVVSIMSSLFMFIMGLIRPPLGDNLIYILFIALSGGIIIYLLASKILEETKETYTELGELFEIGLENFKSNIDFILLPDNCLIGLIFWKKLPDITLHILELELREGDNVNQ